MKSESDNIVIYQQPMSTVIQNFCAFCHTSVLSNSFIFFCMSILFLVIFSPGRDILSIQGIHCRNIMWTWIQKHIIYCLMRQTPVTKPAFSPPIWLYHSALQLVSFQTSVAAKNYQRKGQQFWKLTNNTKFLQNHKESFKTT